MRVISQLSAGVKEQTGIELIFIMSEPKNHLVYSSEGMGALFVFVD